MFIQPVCYLLQLMATKKENRVGVNFAIFRSNPWRQFIELLEICCKDTNIHESVENKISDFWLHKAQNVRACHILPLWLNIIFKNHSFETLSNK